MYDISLLFSAIRVENWKLIYDNAMQNDCSIEFVFVGPNEPVYSFPDNFKYIKTANIKPAQCWEIAYRNSNSKLVMFSGDDLLIQGTKPIDKLINRFYELDNYKNLISGVYMGDDGIPHPEDHFVQTAKEPKPKTHLGLYHRKLFEEIGCIDKNFVVAWWDIDIALRARLYGCEIYYCDGVFIQEKSSLWNGIQTYPYYSVPDQLLLQKLWGLNDPINGCNFRTEEFKPFEEKDILLYSQGEKGKWE